MSRKWFKEWSLKGLVFYSCFELYLLCYSLIEEVCICVGWRVFLDFLNMGGEYGYRMSFEFELVKDGFVYFY